MRRISVGKARKGITRSQARSQTCRAAVRVLLSAQAAVSSSSTCRAWSASAAVLGQNTRPEAGALGLLDPKAEAVAFALERDADRDVDGLLADDLLVADRDLHRVQVDGDVQLLERP